MKKQELNKIAKAIKLIDEVGISQTINVIEARYSLINTIFMNGYELENLSYKLVKSAYQRELIGVAREAQETKYILTSSTGIHVIGSNFVELPDEIFEKELHEFRIVHRESLIDDLCMWIAECKNADKELMKQDLKMLMNWNDDYILSSNSTNEYINSNSHNFNEVCEELIELNKSYK